MDPWACFRNACSFCVIFLSAVCGDVLALYYWNAKVRACCFVQIQLDSCCHTRVLFASCLTQRSRYPDCNSTVIALEDETGSTCVCSLCAHVSHNVERGLLRGCNHCGVRLLRDGSAARTMILSALGRLMRSRQLRCGHAGSSAASTTTTPQVSALYTASVCVCSRALFV